MCGIALIPISEGSNSLNRHRVIDNDKCIRNRIPEIDFDLSPLSKRGPDSINSCTINSTVQNFNIIGSVLHVQGNIITSQPLQDGDGNSFCWNGEVFGGFDLIPNIGDTSQVFELLLKSNDISDNSLRDTFIVESLASIHGPYAFIFYSVLHNAIYFGRDPFGRRSLLQFVSKHIDGMIHSLSSVKLDINDDLYNWVEVPTQGIFKVNLNSNSLLTELIGWPSNRIVLQRSNLYNQVSNDTDVSLIFLETLKHSINKRLKVLREGCSVGILFSGGIDSVLLSAVLHLSIADPSHSIDLINVSFYNENKIENPSPDRLSSILAFVELKRLFPSRTWNLVHVDVSTSERLLYESEIHSLIYPADTAMDLNIGTAFYFAARGKGYLKSYTDEDVAAAFEINNKGRPLLRLGGEGASRAVGGEAKSKKSNVVICSEVSCNKSTSNKCINLKCKKCCRKLEFDLSSKCPFHALHQKVRDLDESISVEPDKQIEYEGIKTTGYKCNDIMPGYISNCKILLVGIGADEQMAGYGRHRTVFSATGYKGLEEEINMDLSRLWKRNLGRDDRCISSHGKEAWFPFLDEDLVRYLQGLPLNQVSFYTYPC